MCLFFLKKKKKKKRKKEKKNIFFFQAEDGIRDRDVTGVQTCALRSASVMCYHWAIYAPAANLSCGSRFSGSLSGIEP